MAIKNRAGIQATIDNNLPTGGTGIQAVDHREVHTDIKDSSVNRTDDDAKNVVYDNTVAPTPNTIFQEIELLKTQISNSTVTLRRGYVNLGNAFGLVNGSALGTNPGGDFTAIVSTSNNTDTLITVNFVNSIGNTNYKVNTSFISLGVNFDLDNDLVAPVIKNKTSGSFQIGFRNVSAVARNIRVEIEVNEFVL